MTFFLSRSRMICRKRAGGSKCIRWSTAGLLWWHYVAPPLQDHRASKSLVTCANHHCFNHLFKPTPPCKALAAPTPALETAPLPWLEMLWKKRFVASTPTATLCEICDTVIPTDPKGQPRPFGPIPERKMSHPCARFIAGKESLMGFQGCSKDQIDHQDRFLLPKETKFLPSKCLGLGLEFKENSRLQILFRISPAPKATHSCWRPI